MICRKQQGFTLHELLVSMAIFATIVSLSLPSIKNNIDRNRVYQATTDIYRLLIYTRSQAINLNKVTTLCASSDKRNCEKTRDWSGLSLMIFIDLNNNGIRDDKDRILQIHQAENLDGFIHYRAFQNKSYIQWLPTGATNYQSGNITYCLNNKNEKEAKILIMNFFGRPYFGRDKDNDGIAENGSGKNLTCSFS